MITVFYSSLYYHKVSTITNHTTATLLKARFVVLHYNIYIQHLPLWSTKSCWELSHLTVLLDNFSRLCSKHKFCVDYHACTRVKWNGIWAVRQAYVKVYRSCGTLISTHIHNKSVRVFITECRIFLQTQRELLD